MGMTNKLPNIPPDSSEPCDGGQGEERSEQAEMFALLNALNEGTLETLGQIVRGEIGPVEIQKRAEALRHGYAQLGLSDPLQAEEGKDGPSFPPVSNE